ncbi:MAG: hypothetical protein ACJAW3_001329 [Lentimonas sp.]|jgi:hypothetical protein
MEMTIKEQIKQLDDYFKRTEGGWSLMESEDPEKYLFDNFATALDIIKKQEEEYSLKMIFHTQSVHQLRCIISDLGYSDLNERIKIFFQSSNIANMQFRIDNDFEELKLEFEKFRKDEEKNETL